jgi:hypothetical protein
MPDTPNLGAQFLAPLLIRDQARRAEQQFMTRLMTPIAVDLKKHDDNLQMKLYSEDERTRREAENLDQQARDRMALQRMIGQQAEDRQKSINDVKLAVEEIKANLPDFSVEGTMEGGIHSERKNPDGTVTITQITEPEPELTDTQKRLLPIVQNEIGLLDEEITKSRGPLQQFYSAAAKDSMDVLWKEKTQEVVQLSTPGAELPSRFRNIAQEVVTIPPEWQAEYDQKRAEAKGGVAPDTQANRKDFLAWKREQ